MQAQTTVIQSAPAATEQQTSLTNVIVATLQQLTGQGLLDRRQYLFLCRATELMLCTLAEDKTDLNEIAGRLTGKPTSAGNQADPRKMTLGGGCHPKQADYREWDQ